MHRSRVELLAWVVAAAFVLGTVLVYVDRLNLYATPPTGLDAANLVDRILGSADYRQAIWPIFLWTNLLFAIGFAAGVAFAVSVASAADVPGGMPAFVALATTGGIIATMASIIPLGAVNSTVWLQYCDCGFKETEVVSGAWAQMVALDVSDWFSRFASVVLGIALVVLVRDLGARISSGLQLWTYLTAALLIVVPVLLFVDKFDPLPEYATTLVGGVLVPVWAVWLARTQGRGAPSSESA